MANRKQTDRILLPIKSISPCNIGDDKSCTIELAIGGATVRVTVNEPLKALVSRLKSVHSQFEKLPEGVRGGGTGGSQAVLVIEVKNAFIGVAPASKINEQELTL